MPTPDHPRAQAWWTSRTKAGLSVFVFGTAPNTMVPKEQYVIYSEEIPAVAARPGRPATGSAPAQPAVEAAPASMGPLRAFPLNIWYRSFELDDARNEAEAEEAASKANMGGANGEPPVVPTLTGEAAPVPVPPAAAAPGA
jgi:hypothetical protein